ncbi:Aromatic acid exporter family member 1 [Agromyces sp. CF514]|uniref:FUSC family protein n=1 Tax=Agromyces sp. CF514 TaxID=1881031 RepID=UPI0008DF9373|nr:FUSC family protein [Agromyces sp. CF514]SFR83144.1 Aromatic acid exporter family member 1 [Agromyces sp. CF514]
MAVLDNLRTSKRLPVLQVLKTSVATIAAWLIAGALIPAQLPVFAAIAALLVVQPSVNQSLGKGIERSIGVLLGVIVASSLAFAFGDSSWIVLVAVLVAMAIAWVLKVSPATGNQVAISAMLTLALGASTPNYALDRVLETLIGAAIGIIVNAAIVPPVAIAPARREAALLGGELAASADRLARALETKQTRADIEALMIEARLLRPMREAADAAIAAGTESLTLNPRRSAHREELAQLRELLDQLGPIVTQLIGMTRAFADHYDASLHDEPTVKAIAEQLHRVAHDIRLAARVAQPEPEPMTSTVPALTSALVVHPPTSSHWILIGSLMEDLRRIREELGAES